MYRLGDTLGDGNSHWIRAKFYQQYRLFYRFDSRAKIIIYAWVNDDDTKRSRGSKTDAYAIFKKMIASGNPPNSWDDTASQIATL
jgi:toxin YhaV